MDFLSDPLFDGLRIRISRSSPVNCERQSYRGSELLETLERVPQVHGKPRTMRAGSGQGLTCKGLDPSPCPTA